VIDPANKLSYYDAQSPEKYAIAKEMFLTAGSFTLIACFKLIT
jgi:hypothetical protein